LKAPVLTPESDKTHAELRLLYQSLYQSPCSAFIRENQSKTKALELLQLMQCIAAYLQHALP